VKTFLSLIPLILLALVCAACQAPPSIGLLSNDEIIGTLEPALASEVRFLQQHLGSRQAFTFSGSSGCFPRDRKAFGRLLSNSDVELFLRLARARDPVVAAYGVEGVRVLARQRLPELLPMLLLRRERYVELWDDLGSNHAMPELAAMALSYVSPQAQDAEIERYLEIWLTRIRQFSLEPEDQLVAQEFVRLKGWPGLKSLKLSAHSRELLPVILPLCGLSLTGDVAKGAETVWHYPPGSALRKAMIQFWFIRGQDRPLLDADTIASTVHAVKQRTLTENAKQDSSDVLVLEVLAAWADYPNPADPLARGPDFTQLLSMLLALDDYDWMFLANHPNSLVAESVRVFSRHPLLLVVHGPPADTLFLKYWIFRHSALADGDADAVDAALTASPDSFPQFAVGNCTHTHPISDPWHAEFWFEPQFTRTARGLPRFWLEFGLSARRDLRWVFYRALERLMDSDFQELLTRDAHYFGQLMAIAKRDAASSDLFFKWLARDWLVQYEANKSGSSNHAAEVLAMSYADELALDHLTQSQVAPRCFHIVENAVNGYCRAAGRDGWGCIGQAEDLGSPIWRLFCRLYNPVSPFGDAHLGGIFHPDWLTLEERRKLESEPWKFWNELQRELSNLKR